MKHLRLPLVLLCLLSAAFLLRAQAVLHNAKIRNATLGAPPGPSQIVYADWSGIDAMSVPTTYTSSGTAQGAQIGGSNWQWQYGNTNTTTYLKVTNNANDPMCPSGHNCVELFFSSADGTTDFPNYIYLSPAYSNWSGDPTQLNGSSSTGGIWFQYYVITDSATNTYVNNASSQIKQFLDRYSPADYGGANSNDQSDGGGGFKQDVFGNGCGLGQPTYTCIYDDSTTGDTYYEDSNPVATTSGMTIKCHLRRNTSTSTGYIDCSVNDTDLGSVASSVFGTNITGQIMGFHVGIRYFQACTNGCTDDTAMKLVLSNIEVCNYNCVGFP